MKQLSLLSIFLAFFNACIMNAQDLPVTPLQTQKSGASAGNQEFTFRQTTWGMSKDEVKRSEKLKLINGDTNRLFYKGIIDGMVTLVVYKFSKGKLSSGTYFFEEEHSNKNDYIDYYEKMKSSLVRMYDTPKEDRTDWKNDTFRDSPQNWGTAISVGFLEYLTYWEKNKT